MTVQIEHYRDMGAFDYGAVMRMTPLIRRVVCRNPTPFTYKGTGTYIVGTGRVAVIDPGPPLSSHVDDVLAALGPGETVTHVLITHTHSDHSSLTARLQELTGARSYGFGPHGAVRAYDPDDRVDFSAYFTAEEKSRFDKEWDDLPAELKREGPDLDFRPDERLGDGDVVRGGNWTMTAVHTPGHCSNHLCYHLQEENCLFSGDHVMGWATSVVSPPDGSMQTTWPRCANCCPAEPSATGRRTDPPSASRTATCGRASRTARSASSRSSPTCAAPRAASPTSCLTCTSATTSACGTRRPIRCTPTCCTSLTPPASGWSTATSRSSLPSTNWLSRRSEQPVTTCVLHAPDRLAAALKIW